eukprot:gene23426-28359_t
MSVSRHLGPRDDDVECLDQSNVAFVCNLLLAVPTMRSKQAEYVCVEATTGYAQVLGPTIEMFGSDMPTILYRSLSTPLSLIQLPLAWMTQLQCTTHGLAGEEDDSDTEQVVSAFLVEHVVMACMPWLVVLVFGMILVTLHHQERRMVMTTTEQRRPPKMSRRNGANVSHIVVSLDTVNKDIEELGIRKGACVAAISLLLTLLYPTVGRQMFKIFHCDEVLYDEDPGTVVYWLRYDRTVKCFDGVDWWLPAGFTFITVVVYIIGFPSAVAVLLHGQYSKKRYEVFKDQLGLVDAPWKNHEARPSAGVLSVWKQHAQQRVRCRRARRHSFPGPTSEPYPTMTLNTKELPDKNPEKAKPASSKFARMSFIVQAARAKELAKEKSSVCDDRSQERKFTFAKSSEVYLDEKGQMRSFSMFDGAGHSVRLAPVMEMISLRKGSQRFHATGLNEQSIIFYLGRLYLGLNPDMYYFSCITLVRRLLQTGFIVVVQIVAPRPFRIKEADNMETVCTGNILLTLYILYFQDSLYSEDGTGRF